MHNDTSFSRIIPQAQDQKRIDQYLAQEFPHYSRTFFSKLIDKGLVAINGRAVNKASFILKTDDLLSMSIPEEKFPDPAVIKEHSSCLDIIFEHDHFLIINKPAGLLVHEASSALGQTTLVDLLLARMPHLATIGPSERPGIVHRLDKDTSGLMIVARTNYGHMTLGHMFKERLIKKTYHALAYGQPPAEGMIDLLIGRHPTQRHKMGTFPKTSFPRHGQREATTYFKVLNYFDGYALVQAQPVTGRTHQIRVHLAAIGHALIGDKLYGAEKNMYSLERQALHAYQLEFNFDNKQFVFTQPCPSDFTALLDR